MVRFLCSPQGCLSGSSPEGLLRDFLAQLTDTYPIYLPARCGFDHDFDPVVEDFLR